MGGTATLEKPKDQKDVPANVDKETGEIMQQMSLFDGYKVELAGGKLKASPISIDKDKEPPKLGESRFLIVRAGVCGVAHGFEKDSGKVIRLAEFAVMQSQEIEKAEYEELFDIKKVK